jgi:phospholipid/cholesterol/gamma-HCH transport system ATP-binding protein
MPANEPVLYLHAARPVTLPDHLPISPISLRLMPGELALIDTRNATVTAWFADLCCGLVPLADGDVRFLGQGWTKVPDDFACALRGRIGRVFTNGAWLGFLDMATNILLPQLHHRRDPRDDLRDQATTLARAFGLPGLPLEAPDDLSAIDLARAGCVRAFLGDPALPLLESPLQGRFTELMEPLLNALATVRHNGGAAIWLTRNDLIWSDRSFPAEHRLRLGERGLVSARAAA